MNSKNILARAKNHWYCYLALLPALLVIFTVIGYPIVRAFQLSFFQKELLSPWKEVKFIGLKNFRDLVASSQFRFTLLRTLGWTVGSVSLKVILGLGGALLFRGIVRGKTLLRTLIMPAWAVPLSISAIVWGWMYNGQFGIINGILLRLGVISGPIEFLAHTDSAFLAALINDAWKGTPFMILIILSGLQAVPQDLYEAARVDGASIYQKFFYVTLPQIKATLLISTLLSTVWTFNSFDVIWTMTGGGPLNATTTLIISAYKKTFGSFHLGEASAVSVVIFVVLMVVAYFYARNIELSEG